MFKIKKNKFNVKISEKAKYMTPKENLMKIREKLKEQIKKEK